MTSAFIVVPREGSVGAARGELTLAQRPRRQLPDDAAVDPLREHLLDPDVTDVFVNGERGVFVDRGRGAEPVDGWRPNEAEVRALAVALVAIGGRHLDDATPCADVRWAGGIRVHAVLSPVACEGSVISIRLPAIEQLSLADLEQRGMFDAAVAEDLHRLVAQRTNLLVTGATGAGNTTWDL